MLLSSSGGACNRGMPGGVLTLLLARQHGVVARLVLLTIVVTETRAAVWPGHADYPLGLLDGTDGFRVTAESSAGRFGYSVAGAGVSGMSHGLEVFIGRRNHLSRQFLSAFSCRHTHVVQRSHARWFCLVV